MILKFLYIGRKKCNLIWLQPENSNKRLIIVSTIYIHNDQANMKNVSGKTMSNNCAEGVWEIEVSIYREYMWQNDLACYFKNLLMLNYVFITYIANIIVKTLNENEFTDLPLRIIGTCVLMNLTSYILPNISN